jgi:hypothetical protein
MKSLLTIVLGLLVLPIHAEETPAKQISVAYLFNDAPPFNLQEIGASASATLEDTLAMKVMLASSKETTDDSRWTFHSVDGVGNEIRARREGDGTLKTEGQYVFVTYSIENLQKTPAVVPPCSLIDDKGRKFVPIDYPIARRYLPAEYDTQEPRVNAGIKRRNCSIYELPKGARPVSIEVLPLCMTAHHKLMTQNGFTGKKINLVSVENNAPALSNKVDTVKKTTSAQIEKPFLLTMKCTRTENTEDKIGRSFVLRALGYTVELKLLNAAQKDVSVKAYFMGETGGNKLMISEVVEKEAAVVSTKATSFRVACQPVGENERRDSGLELKGVIIQAWADGKLVQSYTSQYAWKKYAEMPDLLTKFEMYKRPHQKDRPFARGGGK